MIGQSYLLVDYRLIIKSVISQIFRIEKKQQAANQKGNKKKDKKKGYIIYVVLYYRMYDILISMIL